ncbi:MAG: hypothetical protein CMF45_08355 [Legionellales bacterium]|nr:hypothetical protein [Legionellales bacterium]|tara:strand:+ start:7738 stop:8943 length:1206 start_codon:yes stop_codon:yes gene_type:complete
MKESNKKVCVFHSQPCSIVNKRLLTDSSWFKFIAHFGSRGDAINIISPELKENEATFSIDLVADVKFNKTKHFYFDSFKEYYVQVLFNPFQTVKKYYSVIKRSNIVVFRIPTPGFCLVSVIAFICKKPIFVFVSGNIIEQSDTYANSSSLMRLFFWFFLKIRIKFHAFFLTKSRRVFCVSKEVQELYGLAQNEFVEIYRTPVISINDIIDDNYKQVITDSEVSLKIIRVCWLQKSKGLENLIFAVHKLNSKIKVTLDIYGVDKDKKYGEKILTLINKLELDHIVHMKGWVSHQKIIDKYSHYDLHVISSLSEGMPRACIEASSKGVPQVVTPVGGIPDFFTHLHDAFIVKDCTSESLVEGIDWIYKNRTLAHGLGFNAMIGSRKNSIEIAAQRFNQLLDEA